VARTRNGWVKTSLAARFIWGDSLGLTQRVRNVLTLRLSREANHDPVGDLSSRGRAFALRLRQIGQMTARAWDSADLYDLRFGALWRAVRGETLAFWLLCAYLMFEYVRPQSVYTGLAIFPWSTATMMATGVAWLASGGTRRITSPANGFLMLYTFVVVLSSINAYLPEWSFSQIDTYFLWLVAYALIIHIVTTERRMLLLILAFVLFNLKMSLFATRAWASVGFAFRDWGTGGAPGWFQNSGEFGIEMCVFFPIVTYLALGLRPYLPRWKFLALLGVAGTSLVGMVASSSRGALLGGAAVMVFMLARSKYKMRALVAGIVVATVLFFSIPAEQMQRLSESGTDRTSVQRIIYWKHGIEMANDFPLLGVGYGNWLPYYSEHFSGRVQVCHNIFVQAASELGYSGLLAFLLLIGCTFVLNGRSRALAKRAGPQGRLTYYLALGLDGALIGFVVSGSFVTVLYYPYFWINLAMTVALNTVARHLPVTAPGRVADQLPLPEAPHAPVGNPGFRPALPSR
jgi:putative inorganic carbon (HCO3(-)) transporter